ncbi:MAG: PKD domain-containing protein [Methanospirillum sp.]|nr:PKD domain-containing protein [Methanospirillum sp.]
MYTYIWDFGDGLTDTSNMRNVQHTYSKGGEYFAQLQIQDQTGAKHKSSASVPITVTNSSTQPQASFTAHPLNGSAPLFVSFTDDSISTVPITGYAWDFGDGITRLREKNPFHTYQKNGTYDVTLTITTADGLNTTTTKPSYIHVEQNTYPMVKFSAFPLKGPAPQVVNFIDQSILDPRIPERLYQYIWNFGDGSQPDTSNKRNIKHRYEKPGEYHPQLQIKDLHGIIYTSPDQVIINLTGKKRPLTALFNASPTTGEVPLEVRFTDKSISMDPHLKYAWNFGDNTPESSEKNPTHWYTTPGTYNVSLTITSDRLGSDTCLQSNYITASNPASCTIMATSSPGGTISPSGLVKVIKNADQSFIITPDTGFVTKDVQIDNRSIGSVSEHTFDHVHENHTIHAVFGEKTDLPVARFTVDKRSGSVPLTIRFTDTSTGSPNSWYWNFGDEQGSSEQNPSHTYTTSGQFTVELTIRNNVGMSDFIQPSYIIAI